MNETDNVLVTGAGGFIGGRVVEKFALTNAANVLAGVHRFASAPRIARFAPDITQLDVLDEESLREAMAGQDYVVHCVMGSREAIIDGTENVLRAAHDAGVERVVYLSTADVYGLDDGVYDESSPLHYSGDEYADAKIIAEKHCTEYMKRGLSITVLRPTIVYGPFSTHFTVKIARLIASGLWGETRRLNGICHPVYVDDVVQAIERSLRTDAAHNERFNVAGPTRLTWDEYFRRLNEKASITDLSSRSLATLYLWALAVTPLRLVGRELMASHEDTVVSATSQSRKLKWAAELVLDIIDQSPTLRDLDLYRRKAVYSTEKARKVLGYEPRFDLDEGLSHSVEWLRHHGYLEDARR